MTYDIKTDKNSKEIYTNHLIVLCELGEDYKSFCDDLEELIKSKSNRNLVDKVYRIIQGELAIGSGKYKEFIEKYKHVIEVMNEYSCLSNLTVLSYDAKGRRYKDLVEDYFYQYIQEHKKDIETIKAVALKIKSLGFSTIIFGEKLDFTERQYILNFFDESDFEFLENIEINTTYDIDPITYRTNSSCYCLYLKTTGDVINKKKIYENDRSIELNSLIFDPNRLPNEITTESTIRVIYELKEKKLPEQIDLRHAVDLSVADYDLKSYFERWKKISKRINNVKDDPELINLLNQMQNILAQLQSFEKKLKKQIVDSYPDITDETIEEGIKQYLDIRKRQYPSIDLYKYF